MTYQPGDRLLLKSPLHHSKPDWYTVKTEPNRWGILLVESDTGALSGLTVQQIKQYQLEPVT